MFSKKTRGKNTHSTAKCTKDMKCKLTKEPEKAKNMKGSSKIFNNKVCFRKDKL